MGKDPAVLFYTGDFLVGTMKMNYSQKGRYIQLLCLQHQDGRLSEDDMLEICGGFDEKIFSKFVKDENGKYYNERMEKESVKRRKFVESRQKNLVKTDTESHMESHMGDHTEVRMENENINGIININNIIEKGERDKKKVPKKKEKEPCEAPKDVLSVFEHWKSYGLFPREELTEKKKSAIKKALKTYGEAEVIDTIDRYITVILDESYFFNTRWYIDTFLSQSNAFAHFTESGEKWVNYISKKPQEKKQTELDRFMSELQEYESGG